ncbi:MAG: CvpA family protein [Bacteroides sp.]|nr:CvpA family protein [Bacteroides sp.]
MINFAFPSARFIPDLSDVYAKSRNKMSEATYHIIVIVVAAVAVIKGFHSGFTGQVSGVLGFAFGTVCTHVFGEQAESILRFILPFIKGNAGALFIYSVISSTLVYSGVYSFFRMLTRVLRSAMQVFYVGMLDKLLGAAFCMAKYMLALSIIYNLIVCVYPSSKLMKYATCDDGNLVECVMLLAPELLGCHSIDDLYHLLQLRDAKKISHNINNNPNVITKESYA